MLREGETVFPREDNNWISSTNWSALKTCTQITQTEKTAFRNMIVYTHMYTYTHITMKDEAMNLKIARRGSGGSLEGGKGKMIELYHNLKN